MNFDDLDDFPVFYLPDDFDLDSLGFDHLGGEPSLAKSRSQGRTQGRNTYGMEGAMGDQDTSASMTPAALLKVFAKAAEDSQVGANSNFLVCFGHISWS